VAGVLLLALNLRPAVTDVPSILDEIGSKLDYSGVLLTVLTTIPVVCFAAFSPVAGWVGRRLGDERSLGIAIVAVAAGQAVRALAPSAAMLAGTAVTAAGIALMNVLLSSLVKRRAPHRAAHLLGAYLAMLYLGAMAGSAISVPLYRSGGHSISLPLGVWVAPAVLAAVLWVPQLGRHTVPEPSARAVGVPLLGNRLAWWVTGFMGLQSLTFYGALSILPDLYRSRGMDPSTAGLVNTMLSVGGLISAVSAPVVVARFGVGRPVLVASAVASVLTTAAPLFVPLGAALPCAFVLGLTQGVTISLALYFIMARAATPEVAGALSGMAQGFGYLIAVTGPLGAGLLHSATGSWGPSIGLLIAFTVATFACGVVAAQDRVISGTGRTAPASASG
jgi:CP family cyanate transporter-like MFS transporter